MLRAARSFTDPPGLAHSAFASSAACGNSAPILRSRTSGVFPIRDKTSVACFNTGCKTASLGPDIIDKLFGILGDGLVGCQLRGPAPLAGTVESWRRFMLLLALIGLMGR